MALAEDVADWNTGMLFKSSSDKPERRAEKSGRSAKLNKLSERRLKAEGGGATPKTEAPFPLHGADEELAP